MKFGVGSRLVLWVVILAFATGCGVATTSERPAEVSGQRPAPSDSDRARLDEQMRAQASVAACDEKIDVYRDGEKIEQICPSEAEAKGLTVVDLSDQWTPFILTEDSEHGRQPYRDTYLKLADERLREVPEKLREQYLELFGIFPTFRVLMERFGEERMACHAQVESEALLELKSKLVGWVPYPVQKRQLVTKLSLERRLQKVADRRGLEDIASLEKGANRELRLMLQRYERARVPVEATLAAQAHLRCDGFEPRRRKFRDGIFDFRTAESLRDWQRMHMVVTGGHLDVTTARTMAHDVEELAFRSFLRVLRERVISATGLIEDGSASASWGKVLGRFIEGPEFRATGGHVPFKNGAPDLISPATEAAAVAMGWNSLHDVHAFFAKVGEDARPGLKVAVPLPPLPEYHSEHMELSATVFRGDVWYDYPYREDGTHLRQPVQRRPVTVLYATHNGEKFPIARFNTTIGGWQPELDETGAVGLKYKESPHGPFAWKDIIASPAWLPPDNTPDDEFLRNTPQGLEVKDSILGPGYRSAYGLVMMIHHKTLPPLPGTEETRFFDDGIRSHGSVSYGSINRGYSHGCHRLYNHLATRLTSFLLRHRNHVRHGHIPANYERIIEHEEETFEVKVETRGYGFELTPPIPVRVFRGRIRGRTKEPSLAFHPLRSELIAQAQAEADGEVGEAGEESGSMAPGEATTLPAEPAQPAPLAPSPLLPAPPTLTPLMPVDSTTAALQR